MPRALNDRSAVLRYFSSQPDLVDVANSVFKGALQILRLRDLLVQFFADHRKALFRGFQQCKSNSIQSQYSAVLSHCPANP